jgi:hypothetical protein
MTGRRTPVDRRWASRSWWRSNGRLIPVTLAIATAGSVMSIGSVHVASLFVWGIVFHLLGIVVLLRGGKPPAVALICAIAAVWTILQAMPLPRALVELLSPEAARIWSRAYHLASHGDSGTARLSVSPSASWLEAFKWSSYAAAAVAGAFVARTHGTQVVTRIIFGSALSIGAVSLVHELAGLHALYGLYAPRFATGTWPLSPLINANNFAGYMNLGVFAGAALLRRSGSATRQALTGLGVSFLLAMMVITASRGAIACFAVCAALFVTADLRRAQGRVRLLVLACLAGGLGLAALSWSTTMSELLWSRDILKVRVLQWVWPMLADFRAAGVGRGAYEAVFPAYARTSTQTLFASPENFVVQFLVEWGPPMGAALLIAFGWALRPSHWAHWPAAPARYVFAAFAALVLQNLVDLSLEVPGVALTLSVLLGGHTAAAHSASTGPLGSKHAGRALALALAVAGVSLGLVSLRSKEPVAARDELRVAFADASRARPRSPTFERQLEAAVFSSPAAPYPSLLGGLYALHHRLDSLPWALFAVERAPYQAPGHILLARSLKTHGREGQATLHLRLANTYDPNLVRETTRIAQLWGLGQAQFLDLAPKGHAGEPVLLAMADAVASHGFELRAGLLREALARNPKHYEALRNLGSLLLAAAAAGKPPCAEPPGCVSEARALAARLKGERPVGQDWVLLDAEALTLQGNLEGARDLLSSRCPHSEPRLRCLQFWFSTNLKTGNDAASAQEAVRLIRQDCGGADSCAAAEREIARVYRGLGWVREALGPLRRAAELDPSSNAWLELAEVSATSGSIGDARRALRRAADDATPAQMERITKLLEQLETHPAAR